MHFRVKTIDKEGRQIGYIPSLRMKLSNGCVWEEIYKRGTITSPPTSGNSYSREALKKIFPIKDAIINNSGTYFDVIPTDSYLKLRAPLYGSVIALSDCLAVKRIHGANNKGKSPYFYELKRHRHLMLAKINEPMLLLGKLHL